MVSQYSIIIVFCDVTTHVLRVEGPSGSFASSSPLRNHPSSPSTASVRIAHELFSQEDSDILPATNVHRTLSKYSFASDTDLLPPNATSCAPNSLQVRNIHPPVDNGSLSPSNLHKGGVQQRVALHRQGTDDGVPHLVEGKSYEEENVIGYHLDYAGSDKEAYGVSCEEAVSQSSKRGDANASYQVHQDTRPPRNEGAWARVSTDLEDIIYDTF